MKWKPVIILYLTLGLISYFAMANDEETSKQVFAEAQRLLYSGKPEEALALWEQDFQATGSQRSFFGIAWVEFFTGDYANAESSLTYLLSDRLNPRREAACKEALGLVYSRTGRHEEAIESLEQAMSIYRSAEDDSGILKLHMALAEAYLNGKDLQNSGIHLRLAFHLNKKVGMNLGFFFSLKTRLAFAQRDYEAARNASLLSLQEYQKGDEQAGLAWAWTDLGFFQHLVGNSSLGEQARLEADRLLQQLGLTHFQMWNSLSSLLAAKCNRQPFGQEQNQLENYILSTNDQPLRDAFSFVMSWECTHPQHQ